MIYEKKARMPCYHSKYEKPKGRAFLQHRMNENIKAMARAWKVDNVFKNA